MLARLSRRSLEASPDLLGAAEEVYRLFTTPPTSPQEGRDWWWLKTDALSDLGNAIQAEKIRRKGRQMHLPKGYSVLEVAENRAILFSPRDVRSPETGAYRGKRRVASFDPAGGPEVEEAVAMIAEADAAGNPVSVSAIIGAFREVA